MRRFSIFLVVALLGGVVFAHAAGAEEGHVPKGATQSFRAGVAYLAALHQADRQLPLEYAQPLNVMKIEDIQMKPGSQEPLFCEYDLYGQPLPAPEFAGLRYAADSVLFPAPQTGSFGQAGFSAFSPGLAAYLGFLASYDFRVWDLAYIEPTWWDHPTMAPGLTAQYATSIHSPHWPETGSAEQGNETPTLASAASGRGGTLNLLIEHLRPNELPGNDDGLLRFPQHSLTFIADGKKYVAEFREDHLTDGYFEWGSATDLRDEFGIDVAWPDFDFYGLGYSHSFRAIVVASGRSIDLGGAEHEVVQLYAHNPGENFITVLANPDRQL